MNSQLLIEVPKFLCRAIVSRVGVILLMVLISSAAMAAPTAAEIAKAKECKTPAQPGALFYSPCPGKDTELTVSHEGHDLLVMIMNKTVFSGKEAAPLIFQISHREELPAYSDGMFLLESTFSYPGKQVECGLTNGAKAPLMIVLLSRNPVFDPTAERQPYFPVVLAWTVDAGGKLIRTDSRAITCNYRQNA